jgi:ribosomal protein S18 acetylase RimI-like enzyme
MSRTTLEIEEQLTCVVRAPRPRDLPRMAELAEQLGYQCKHEDIRARLREMQSSREHAVFIAELSKEQVVGWIGVYVFRSVELDPFAEISGVVVDQKNRSCGVGTLLLGAAEHWARSIGSKVLCVRSNIIRARAHHFYVKNGFELIKTQRVFRKSLSK